MSSVTEVSHVWFACMNWIAIHRAVFTLFPVRLRSQGSRCVGTPSGRGGLGEMVGCALLQVGIEVMRKSAPFSNTYANCAAESAVAAVGSMFSVLARAL